MSRITVFMPVYNTEKFVGKAIDSILAQTYVDFELLILDDCSTDRSFEICQDYAKMDSRVRLIRNEQNLGMMGNWNRGIKLAKGEFWAKLDADDIWGADMLEECMHVMEEYPEVGMVCSRHMDIDENDRPIEGSTSNPPEHLLEIPFSFRPFVESGVTTMLANNIARQGIGLIRTEFFEKFGNYLTIQPADTELYFRIGAHYKVYCLNKVLHKHRIWSESDTRSTILGNAGKKEKNLFDVRNAILEHYHSSEIIWTSVYQRFKRDNRFEYLKFLRAHYLHSGMYLKSSWLVIKLFFLYPSHFFKFYLRRLNSKIAGR